MKPTHVDFSSLAMSLFLLPLLLLLPTSSPFEPYYISSQARFVPAWSTYRYADADAEKSDYLIFRH